MAKSEKRQFGDLGEDIACKYLAKQGYVVKERNYWKPWGELDIVAEKAGRLSFIEVKSVTREPGREAGIRPEENMHPKKIERLYRTIQTYLMEKRIPDEKPWQLDLACVFIDIPGRKAGVELLENIV